MTTLDRLVLSFVMLTIVAYACNKCAEDIGTKKIKRLSPNDFRRHV